MNTFFHPYVSRYAPTMTIELLALVDEGLHRIPLYPGMGGHTIHGHESRLLVSADLALKLGTVPVRLYSVIRKGANLADMVVEIQNGNDRFPPGLVKGVFGVIVKGEGIEAQPQFLHAHQVKHLDGVFADAMEFGECQVADQQMLSLQFYVGFGPGETGINRIADEILHPMPSEMPDEVLDVPLISRAHDPWAKYVELLTTPRDLQYGFGHSKSPSQSGMQKRFGWQSYPWLDQGVDLTGLEERLLLAEALRVHSRYPYNTGFMPPGYIPVPDERAIYYWGELSWHSRNRLGRPGIHAPEEEKEPYLLGREGWEAPAGEHCTSILPLLAWYHRNWWAAQQCIRLGYWIMNQTHQPIPVNQGGYDTPYLREPRCFYRSIRLLWQCGKVMQMHGYHEDKFNFLTHCKDMCRWAVEHWKPLDYGKSPTRPDEMVPGYPDERTIAVWQLIGLPILYRVWKEVDSGDAKIMLQDQARQLVGAYVRRGEEWWLRKVVLAADPTMGWEPHSSLDGLIYWPYASLKLIAQKGDIWSEETEIQEKAVYIVADLEKRFPGLVSEEFINGQSQWGCGDYD